MWVDENEYEVSDPELEELVEVPSLINICLNSVCDNIDRFNLAYYTTKDNNMKTSLLFLQRAYSNTIIRMLAQRNNNRLDKKYFDFLINMHLKELDCQYIGVEDLDIILEMLSGTLINLENISFNGEYDRCSPKRKEFCEFVNKALLHLPNVKVLRMVRTDCNDETLKVIQSQCKELKELHLERCPITSERLESLCPEGETDKMLHLQSLTLKYIEEDCEEGVTHLLKNMPSLECIRYVYLLKIFHKLHVDDLRNNSLAYVPKYNLKSLNSYASENFPDNVKLFEETLMIVTELCPHISKIKMNDLITEEQLQILCRFSDLRDVSIRGELFQENMEELFEENMGELFEENMRELKRLYLYVDDFIQHLGTKVRFLEIHGFKLNLDNLIKNCPNLEYILLGDNDYYVSDATNGVTILNKAKILIFEEIEENNQLVDLLNKLLYSCPNLEKLQFNNCSCDEEMSGIVERYCENSETLEKLTFMMCSIESSLLRNIICSRTLLKTLVVDSCHNIRSTEIENLHGILKDRRSRIVAHLHPPSETEEEDVDEEDID